MSAPIHVLHVSPSFFPAITYGGPIFSTKAITDGVAKTEGFTVSVLSTDTANPNNRARLDLPQNPMTMPAGYEVRYCRSVPGSSISIELLLRLLPEVNRADLVHLTGPYNFPVIPTLIACRLTGTPLIWSPRGGFQATAQWEATPKRSLKVAFEHLCAWLSPPALTFHVTAPVEAATCVRHFPNVSTSLIPNAIEVPNNLPSRNWRPNGLLRLAFVSRVHPKKGLDILFPALARLPTHVTLDIYGDGDPDYVRDLQAEADRMNLSERVRFHGYVDGDDKTRALTNCDLFVLPTHSENFGIVVAEALAHGTPVITTMNAPWKEIIAQGCGAWTEATPQALEEAIRNLESADLETLGAQGRNWMERDFSVESMVQKFRKLYRRLGTTHK